MKQPRPCPRCSVDQNIVLKTAFGPNGTDYCANCGGLFLDTEHSESLLYGQLGLDLAFLKELAEHFAGQVLQCSGCPSKMKPIQLQDAMIDLCFYCGGLWCDRGELEKLSQGHIIEPAWRAKKRNIVLKKSFIDKVQSFTEGIQEKIFSEVFEDKSYVQNDLSKLEKR